MCRSKYAVLNMVNFPFLCTCGDGDQSPEPRGGGNAADSLRCAMRYHSENIPDAIMDEVLAKVGTILE